MQPCQAVMAPKPVLVFTHGWLADFELCVAACALLLRACMRLVDSTCCAHNHAQPSVNLSGRACRYREIAMITQLLA